ncbi:20s proteasome beta subunit pbb2 [Nannochloropsis oceanica]
MQPSYVRPRRRPLLLLLRPPPLVSVLLIVVAIPAFSSSVLSGSSSTTSLLPSPPSSYTFSPASLPPPPSCPSVLKTGTTIAGVVCGDSIVLAADTRSTMGQMVADKNCEKIHKLGDAMYCCGAGTAADAEQLTAAVRTWLRLEASKSITTIREQTLPPSRPRSLPRVVAAARGLSRLLGKGGVSAAFVLGGVDATGPSLFQIESDGTTQKVPFTAMGSGFAAAMSVLESQHRSSLSIQEGITLLHAAISSGIMNDLGSGSRVDICVIQANGQVDYRRDVQLVEGPSLPPSISPSSSSSSASSSSSRYASKEDVQEEEEEEEMKKEKKEEQIRLEGTMEGEGEGMEGGREGGMVLKEWVSGEIDEDVELL